MFTDLHCHLHGCLAAKDVHAIGASIWKNRVPALSWYADEYQKHCGKRVFPENYWTADDGAEKLRIDFEMTQPGDFSEFQARFNLLIALFPITPSDTSILQHVVTKDLHSNTLRHREYRLFVPPRFSKTEVYQYIDAHSEALRTLLLEREGGPDLRLAFSLSRNVDLLKMQYEAVKEWQISKAATEKKGGCAKGDLVTAIDFCGDEAGCPPSKLEPFFQTVLRDNKSNPEGALAILYHVGEQWHAVSPGEAIKWVVDASKMGVHRLGHALAIRVDAELLANASTNTLSTLKLTSDKIRQLQVSAWQQLKESNAVIEVCPTSNRIISKSSEITCLPKDFLEQQIDLVLGTDNPGIHSVTPQSEWESFQSNFGEPQTSSRQYLDCDRFHSTTLAGRI